MTEDIYVDVSKPEERKEWFFYDEENRAYAPKLIRDLDSWFCKRIMSGTVMELLALYEEIRGCERLHKVIKDNLLLNIRNKLEAA